MLAQRILNAYTTAQPVLESWKTGKTEVYTLHVLDNFTLQLQTQFNLKFTGNVLSALIEFIVNCDLLAATMLTWGRLSTRKWPLFTNM